MSELIGPKMIRITGHPAIWCPACDNFHIFDARWTWNGDTEKPTFNPSFKSWSEYGPERKLHVCHSFVRNGEWQYLSDCTHRHAGQTVPVPDIPVDERDWAD